MDVVGLFIAERCDTDPTAETKAGELYTAYRVW
jgi:hypothetical protein